MSHLDSNYLFILSINLLISELWRKIVTKINYSQCIMQQSQGLALFMVSK